MKAAWFSERERESSCWVSMICQWVSRAICWLSQTAGDYNYPGTEGGEREACSVNRLPLLSCMDVAHSQGPRSCTSTTLYWAWLLNLFTLGVFSLCNQYSLLLQCTAGTELQEWYELKESFNCQQTLQLLKLLLLLSLIRLWASQVLLLSRQGSSKVIISFSTLPRKLSVCLFFFFKLPLNTVKTCFCFMCCVLLSPPSG